MHRKLLLVLLFLLATSNTFCQYKKFSLEANYPYATDKNIIDDRIRNGVIDIGLKYRFLDVQHIALGASINSGFYRDNIDSNTIEVNYTLLQPRLFGELSIPALESLRPSLGLGYSILFTNTKLGTRLDDELSPNPSGENNETNGGINIAGGVAIEIISNLYIHIQYDWISRGSGSSIKIVKAGVGVNF